MSKVKYIWLKVLTANNAGSGWLAIMRIGAALCMIGKILSEWRIRDVLYGSEGLVPPDIAVFSQNPYIPTVLGIYHRLPVHMHEANFLNGLFICGLLFASSLLLGYMTRLSAFICWALMVTLFNSSHLTSYGFDAILLTLLFYCLIFPVGRYYSIDSKLKPKVLPPNESLTNIFHKTIQLHVCLIYFVNGISKVHGHSWLDGSGLWDAIHQPQFHSLLTPVLIKLFMIPYVPAILSISILAIEIAYPFLIWVRGAQRIIFLLIILLHTSIALIMGLWLFALAMIILNVVAFGHVMRRKVVQQS